jgi:hypothetical protein
MTNGDLSSVCFFLLLLTPPPLAHKRDKTPTTSPKKAQETLWYGTTTTTNNHHNEMKTGLETHLVSSPRYIFFLLNLLMIIYYRFTRTATTIIHP